MNNAAHIAAIRESMAAAFPDRKVGEPYTPAEFADIVFPLVVSGEMKAMLAQEGVVIWRGDPHFWGYGR